MCLWYFILNVWFQIIPIPTPWKVSHCKVGEGGRGISKGEYFKRKYEAKMEFLKQWGRGGGGGGGGGRWLKSNGSSHTGHPYIVTASGGNVHCTLHLYIYMPEPFF